MHTDDEIIQHADMVCLEPCQELICDRYYTFYYCYYDLSKCIIPVMFYWCYLVQSPGVPLRFLDVLYSLNHISLRTVGHAIICGQVALGGFQQCCPLSYFCSFNHTFQNIHVQNMSVLVKFNSQRDCLHLLRPRHQPKKMDLSFWYTH